MLTLRHWILTYFVCGSAIGLLSCGGAGPGETPEPGAGAQSGEPALTALNGAQTLIFPGRPPKPTNDVDVLFVVDNSPSMSPKQRALGAHIKQFITSLD